MRCDRCGMKLNMRRLHVTSPPLTILSYPKLTMGGTVLKSSEITIEKHLRTVAEAASQRLGILKNSLRVFHDRSLLVRDFWGVLMPIFENGSCGVVPDCRHTP